MGVAVVLDGFSLVVVFIVWVLVPAFLGFVLYWIIRLGVKHGLRSYYTDTNGNSPSSE
ncbi:hypothetical protein QFZ50_001125 [Arthrobacter agilis]|nr:hypothetical protein [Arthrobacter agilis]